MTEIPMRPKGHWPKGLPSADDLYRQVEAVREVFVPYDRVMAVQRDLDLLLRRDNGGSEGGILTLLGGSRSGKTKLLLDYGSKHPVVPRGITGPDGVFADRKEVIRMRMPDTNVKNFYERLFCVLSNMTLDEISRGRRFDIQEDVYQLAKTVGTRLMIFEECHEGILNKEKNGVRSLARALKDLTNESAFSIAISGTFETRPLLAASIELEERVLYEHEFHPLDWEVAGDRGMIVDVLRELDEHFREFVFGRLSDLSREEIAKPLMRAASGQIGNAAKLLEVAGQHAVDDLLAGAANCLTIDHLARAFARSPLRRRTPDEFSSPQGQMAAAVNQATNPVTKMTGRTRKSNRDVAFKG